MKWKIVREVLNDTQLNTIYGYCKQKVLEPSQFDEQVPNTPMYANDAMMKYLHKVLLRDIEDLFKRELYPTYTYWRMYKTGDVLHKHKDRPSCEYSATLHIGHRGEDWPIQLWDDKVVTTYLKPGDMLLYKGCEVEHWREQLQGGQYAQAFLHYVDKNGPYKEWRFDKHETY